MAKTTVPIELSSTPSIVDNGNATAITIDSSQNVLLNQTTSLIGANTSDAADNKSVMINGGGSASDSRGAYVWAKGNEHSDAGKLQLNAGNVSGASITFNTSGSERMRIDSSGNVGIGTSTPDYKLEINHTGNDFNALVLNDEATVSNSTGIYLRSTTEGRLTVGTGASMTFYASGGERMRINSTGVGIGTSSVRTGYKLDVQEAANNGVNIQAGDAAADIALSVGSASTADKFVIQAGGNVGIGTSAPDVKLHLEDASRVDIKFEKTGNETHYIRKDGDYLRFRGNDDSTILFELKNNTNGSNVCSFPSGNVGIGTSSPAQTVEVSASATSAIQITSTSGTAQLMLNPFGTNPAYINYNRSSASVLAFYDHNASAERMRIDSSGNVGIGTSAIPRTLTVAGDFEVNSSGTNRILLRYDCTAEGFSTAASASLFGKNNSTGRSINAGGTVNASGADYAEYMKKADSCGTIAKGDVCGVDSTGKLTDVFTDAISFVIKSTNPSYVGGDTWGDVDLGLTEEQTETERQKYDRIAFSGQVPVNITGSFNVGDYVYPQANGTAIECVAKSNPTFEEYQLCVGKIWATEDDGRPIVAVKIG